MTGLNMWAVRLEKWGEPPVLKQVPIPAPAPGQVLLRVTAAGLCHSDLHLMDAKEGQFPFTTPFTLGHEIVGEVVDVGSASDDEWLGRSVAVHALNTCGSCRACTAERENYCDALSGDIGPGIGKDGGLAEYVLIESTRQLVPFDNIDPIHIAPLTDAGVTSFHAIREQSDVMKPGATAVVIGVGGLGHLAVQILSTLTDVQVFAIDTRERARENAVELGAYAAYESIEQLRLDHGSTPVDVVFDFVGSQSTAEKAFHDAAAGGRLVLVGSAGAELRVGKNLGLARGWSISAPFWGTKKDLSAVVALAEEQRLMAHSETWQLSQTLEAYESLRQGKVQGRAVVRPASMSSKP